MDATWYDQPIEALPLKPVVAALPGTTLRQVLANMRQTRVSCVYRLDDFGRPAKQFTEAQLWALMADRGLSLDCSIESYLAPVHQTLDHQATVRELVAHWQGGVIETLCVTNGAGEAVAMIEPAALVRALAEAGPPARAAAKLPAVHTVSRAATMQDDLASA